MQFLLFSSSFFSTFYSFLRHEGNLHDTFAAENKQQRAGNEANNQALEQVAPVGNECFSRMKQLQQ